MGRTPPRRGLLLTDPSPSLRPRAKAPSLPSRLLLRERRLSDHFSLPCEPPDMLHWHQTARHDHRSAWMLSSLSAWSRRNSNKNENRSSNNINLEGAANVAPAVGTGLAGGLPHWWCSVPSLDLSSSSSRNDKNSKRRRSMRNIRKRNFLQWGE